MKQKPKKWIRITLYISLFILLGLGIYAYSIYNAFSKNMNEIHQPLERDVSAKRETTLNVNKKEPFSVLLLGVDQRENDKGRSDTMIVVTVNARKQSVEMVSVPRDTRVTIAGRNKEDKINHAFAFGGPETSIKTVEEFLDIPIDYYVSVNMEGFKDMVDAVGGIDVNNNLNFSYDGHSFKKGNITLNGEEALAYVRMRKEDPQGDFGRQERQRQAIEGVAKKAISFSSLTRFEEIFEALGNNVKTNMTLSNIMDIQKHYKSSSSNITQRQLKGEGKKIKGIYYYIPNEEKLQELKKILKQHLEV